MVFRGLEVQIDLAKMQVILVKLYLKLTDDSLDVEEDFLQPIEVIGKLGNQ